MMVQFEHDKTRESEKVMMMFGGVKYWRAGMMVRLIKVVASIVVSVRV